MATLLHIDSSPMLDGAVTRRLSAHFVDGWRGQHPAGRVLRRDLGARPPPHPDAVTLAAMNKPASARSPEEQAAAVLSDQLLEELEAADVIVVGAPMYNLSVTSGLKAWFDLVGRPGRTFRYTPTGVEGLLQDKSVVVLTGRGGFYARNDGPDHQAALIRDFFGLMGLGDVRFIHAEGQGIDGRTAAAEEAAAVRAIDRLLESGALSRVA
ncbi:MAG: NAD(P)H-dependent oxidoreductase [Gammaproteobacteria bacterium]